MSTNGTTFNTIYTISGDATADAGYTTVYNQDISSYAGATTYLRFLTNNSVDEADYVFIDDVKIQFLKYNQCYITKLAPASVPANYYQTTATQHAVTFTSAGNCSITKDFGIAKNSISISGTVTHDANGLNDSQINGSGFGTVDGTQLYAYLIDSTAKVAFKSTVAAASGQFSFSNADVYTTYTLRITSNNVAQFATGPTTTTLPTEWYVIGEQYGSNNSAGSGIEAGTPNGAITVTTAASNINNIKVGLQKAPDTDTKLVPIPHPFVGQVITLNGGVNPPVLSGSDEEDCKTGCTLATKTVVIDAYPDNADLKYNNVLVTDGQTITNFNPDQLQVIVTNATVGDTTIIFYYSYVDEASKKDTTPAKYTLYWPNPLPATGMVLSVKSQNNNAHLSWMTLTEQNTSHFILERSADNVNFSVITNKIKAAGESYSRMDYSYNDVLPGDNKIYYYRVKLVDLDARTKTSNIVSVKLNSDPGISVWPNPFNTTININCKADYNSIYLLELLDATGKKVYNTTKDIKKGTNQFALNVNLGMLPEGIYLLNITDKNSMIKTTLKMVKTE
jgi:uncharacterized protein Veg